MSTLFDDIVEYLFERCQVVIEPDCSQLLDQNRILFVFRSFVPDLSLEVRQALSLDIFHVNLEANAGLLEARRFRVETHALDLPYLGHGHQVVIDGHAIAHWRVATIR